MPNPKDRFPGDYKYICRGAIMQKKLFGFLCAILLIDCANAEVQVCSPFNKSSTAGLVGPCTQHHLGSAFGRFYCGVQTSSTSTNGVYVSVIPYCSSTNYSAQTTFTKTTLSPNGTGGYYDLTQLNSYCFCRMVEPLLGGYVFSQKKFSTTGECLMGCMAHCAQMMTSTGTTPNTVRPNILKNVVGI